MPPARLGGNRGCITPATGPDIDIIPAGAADAMRNGGRGGVTSNVTVNLSGRFTYAEIQEHAQEIARVANQFNRNQTLRPSY